MKRALRVIAAAAFCCCAGCRNETAANAGNSATVAPDATKSAGAELRAAEPAGRELRRVVLEELERRGSYRRLSAAETERTVQLFAATLSDDAALTELQPQWESEGFELQSVDDGGESFWILKERPGEKIGRGVVVIRPSQYVPVMFQAPHSFYDRDTDVIALGVFVRSRARACYWNTVHRRVADLTKEEDSFLNALSAAFARSHPQGRIAQFHGFARSSNDGRFDQNVDLLISQGTETPSQAFLKVAQGVRRECEPFQTAVFPLDLQQLGGTKNRQREVLLTQDFQDFVHCEMGPAFRRALRDDFDLQTRLGRALTHLELNPQMQ